MCGFAGHAVVLDGPADEGAEGAENVEEGITHFVVEGGFVAGG